MLSLFIYLWFTHLTELTYTGCLGLGLMKNYYNSLINCFKLGFINPILDAGSQCLPELVWRFRMEKRL